ncbi:MAG: preprotein translocase subunit SecA, partial [Myxococcales bacterium]
LRDEIVSMVEDSVASYVNAATEGFAEEWDLEALWTALATLFPLQLRLKDVAAKAGGVANIDRDELREELQAEALKAYEVREQEIGSEVMRELERRVLLSVLDRKWREHLYEMDYLREGIGLRAYSQRDPLVEYQREGFDMFNAMKEAIREETVGFLFNLEVQVEDEAAVDYSNVEIPEGMEIEPGHEGHNHPPIFRPIGGGEAAPTAEPEQHPVIRAKGLNEPRKPTGLSYAGPTEDGEVEVRGDTVTNADDPYAGISRNAECPCGSGKKYKKCHGAPGGPTGLTARANG